MSWSELDIHPDGYSSIPTPSIAADRCRDLEANRDQKINFRLPCNCRDVLAVQVIKPAAAA